MLKVWEQKACVTVRIGTGTLLRVNGFSRTVLPAARRGACCFLRGISLVNSAVFFLQSRVSADARWDLNAGYDGPCMDTHGGGAGGRARVCASLYFGSRSSSVSRTMEEIHLEGVAGRGTDVKWSFSSSSSSGGASRLLSPSVSVSPAGCRYRWTICGGSHAKRSLFRRRLFGGSARCVRACGRACGRAGRGDASRHRSIEQTEH